MSSIGTQKVETSDSNNIYEYLKDIIPEVYLSFNNLNKQISKKWVYSKIISTLKTYIIKDR